MTGDAPDPEPRPTRARVHAGLLRLREAVPALSGVRLERAWAGRIDSTPDALPVIDADSGPAGLVLATGFSGHGFGLAPSAASAAAALVLGTDPEQDVRPFRLSRFPEGDYQAPDAIL